MYSTRTGLGGFFSFGGFLFWESARGLKG